MIEILDARLEGYGQATHGFEQRLPILTSYKATLASNLYLLTPCELIFEVPATSASPAYTNVPNPNKLKITITRIDYVFQRFGFAYDPQTSFFQRLAIQIPNEDTRLCSRTESKIEISGDVGLSPGKGRIQIRYVEKR